MNKPFVLKPEQELEKMPTKRLLSYYRSERKKLHYSGYKCKCGCDEFQWELYSKDEYLEKQYDEHLMHLQRIKQILNKKEHVNNHGNTK